MPRFPSSAQTFEIAFAAGGHDRLGKRVIVAQEGESLLEALQRANTPILSVCGGQASCGACRIGVDPAWLDRLPPAGRTEAALLEFLDDPVPTHRLACQVTATADIAGLRLTLAP